MARQSPDIAAIRQLAEDWRSGWLAGDADALLSLNADAVGRKIARLIDNSDRTPTGNQGDSKVFARALSKAVCDVLFECRSEGFAPHCC